MLIDRFRLDILPELVKDCGSIDECFWRLARPRRNKEVTERRTKTSSVFFLQSSVECVRPFSCLHSSFLYIISMGLNMGLLRRVYRSCSILMDDDDECRFDRRCGPCTPCPPLPYDPSPFPLNPAWTLISARDFGGFPLSSLVVLLPFCFTCDLPAHLPPIPLCLCPSPRLLS